MRERTRAAMQTLAAYTTLRLGGPAERLVTATTEGEAVAAVRDATRAGAPLLVLAGGSNVVIGDDGFDGVVVLLRSRGIDQIQDHDEVRVSVAAGQPWDEVCATAVAAGWAGVECLAGIPGSTGATPIQNVGAYGQEVAETIAAVRVYDRDRDAVVMMAPHECGFGYRTSVFKHNDRFVVLAVDFRLAARGTSAPLRYAELAAALGVPAGGRAPLAEVRAAVLRLRAGKGMVLDPSDPDTYSVGSFFTNPVLPGPDFAALRARAGGAGAGGAGGSPGGPPAWPGADGTVKVSAAWLIEQAGYGKGYGDPGAGVAISGKHTLALTNRGTGTTTALLALAREVRDGVRERFGVTLQPEPVLVNCQLDGPASPPTAAPPTAAPAPA